MPSFPRLRAVLAVVALAASLAGCSLPPLHRSVAVETDANGEPVHASGSIAHDAYTVVRGDTLYSIAFRAGVDYHDLARWNGIAAPYVIHAGQVLRLSRPSDMAAPAPQAPVFETVTPPQPAHAPPPATPAAPPAQTVIVATPAPTIPATTDSTAVPVAGEPVTVVAPPLPAPPIPADATRQASGIVWRWPANGTVVGGFTSDDAMPGILIAGKAGDPVRAAAAGVVVYSGNGLVGYGELVIIKHNDDYLTAYGHNSKRLVTEGEHVEAGQVIARMGSTGAPRDELEFQVRYKGKPVNPLDFLPQR